MKSADCYEEEPTRPVLRPRVGKWPRDEGDRPSWTGASVPPSFVSLEGAGERPRVSRLGRVARGLFLLLVVVNVGALAIVAFDLVPERFRNRPLVVKAPKQIAEEKRLLVTTTTTAKAPLVVTEPPEAPGPAPASTEAIAPPVASAAPPPPPKRSAKRPQRARNITPDSESTNQRKSNAGDVQ